MENTVEVSVNTLIVQELFCTLNTRISHSSRTGKSLQDAASSQLDYCTCGMSLYFTVMAVVRHEQEENEWKGKKQRLQSTDVMHSIQVLLTKESHHLNYYSKGEKPLQESDVPQEQH